MFFQVQARLRDLHLDVVVGKFALDSEKTFARFMYALGIVVSSKDLSNVSSCIYITWKSVGIWVSNPRSNGSSILSVTVELESRHWIVIGSKFRMGLWW